MGSGLRVAPFSFRGGLRRPTPVSRRRNGNCTRRPRRRREARQRKRHHFSMAMILCGRRRLPRLTLHSKGTATSAEIKASRLSSGTQRPRLTVWAGLPGNEKGPAGIQSDATLAPHPGLRELQQAAYPPSGSTGCQEGRVSVPRRAPETFRKSRPARSLARRSEPRRPTVRRSRAPRRPPGPDPQRPRRSRDPTGH